MSVQAYHENQDKSADAETTWQTATQNYTSKKTLRVKQISRPRERDLTKLDMQRTD